MIIKLFLIWIQIKFMKKIILKTTFLLLVTNIYFLGCKPIIETKIVKNGVLDLRDWNPEIDEPIKLDGNWEFYWNQIFEENKKIQDLKNPIYIRVPASWVEEKFSDKTSENFPGYGIATYQCKILLKDITPLAIRLPFLGTAYHFYLDGKKVLTSGVVGTSIESSLGDKNIYYKDIVTDNETVILTIVISNFHNRNGGFWNSLILGSREKIRSLRDKNLASDLFVTGILSIMGTYHLFLFLLLRKDKTPLYFGIFCIVIALRTLLTGENYLYSIYPSMGYIIGIKLEYLSFYLGIPLFSKFILQMYDNFFIKKIFNILNLICIFFSMIIVITPPRIFTETLLIVQIILIIFILLIIFLLLSAILNKRDGAKIFLIGISFFGLIIINDILHSNHFINTGLYSSIGLVIFIFSQSYILTSRFAKSFHKVEELSRDLEIKVEERTISLLNEIKKSTTLNDMISVVIQSKSTDEIFFNIFKILSKYYKLSSYLVYILDHEDRFLKLYRVYGFANFDKKFEEMILKNWFHEDDTSSLHSTVVKNRKSVLIKKVKIPHPCKGESEILNHANVKSFYTIPLMVDNDAFGCISFSNSKYEFANINEINREQRTQIESLVKLISPSIFQSLQKTMIEKAKISSESSLKKANKLNEMVEVIINSKSYEDILQNIYELLNKNYNLDSYLLYLYHDSYESLIYLKEVGKFKYPAEVLNIFKKNEFRDNDSKSVHIHCKKKKRSFYSNTVKSPHPCQGEDENLKILEIKSIYIIPLIVDENVFGTIDFSDNKYEGKGLTYLKKEDRNEIENFIRLISPSILQAQQKNLIEKAYSELKLTQNKLIEAEKMSALGNLVGSIAHEINNPISVIRSNSSLIHRNINFLVSDYPIFLDSLSLEEKKVFSEIIEKSFIKKENLSSREERNKKRELEKVLKTILEDKIDVRYIAENILSLGIESSYKEYFEKFPYEKLNNILNRASAFSKQIGLLKNIEIAIDKASRVVFSLRTYLNVDTSTAKKSCNVSNEIQRVLEIYDNYILGKISLTKEIPESIIIECLPENLFQVWNNIIFNAIQAMYEGEKNLKVILTKSNLFPDELLNYKSSASLEENKKWLESKNDFIIVRIQDYGKGIPQELQDKIFTPFFTTKNLGEGIGLGLFVSKKIVHEHGGRIFFKSDTGSTEFIVVLPTLEY